MFKSTLNDIFLSFNRSMSVNPIPEAGVKTPYDLGILSSSSNYT